MRAATASSFLFLCSEGCSGDGFVCELQRHKVAAQSWSFPSRAVIFRVIRVFLEVGVRHLKAGTVPCATSRKPVDRPPRWLWTATTSAGHSTARSSFWHHARPAGARVVRPTRTFHLHICGTRIASSSTDTSLVNYCCRLEITTRSWPLTPFHHRTSPMSTSCGFTECYTSCKQLVIR